MLHDIATKQKFYWVPESLQGVFSVLTSVMLSTHTMHKCEANKMTYLYRHIMHAVNTCIMQIRVSR